MLSPIPSHFTQDLLLYICFIAGQLLFILRRAGLAIRSLTNPIKTRRQFLYENWDKLLVRALAGAVLIYFPWRHISLITILGWLHIDASIGWLAVLVGSGEASGIVATAALGYASDSLLDWLSISPKIPDWLRRWMRENIPNGKNGQQPTKP
jgi:hypothetical protein